MPERSPIPSGPRKRSAEVRRSSASARLADLAGRQHGAVSRGQLHRLGIGDSAILRSLRAGRLHRLYPGVYAVGFANLAARGRLVAALLYAGPGAALSHLTAAWWWRLIDNLRRTLQVSAPARRRSRPGLRLHQRRGLQLTVRAGIPVTTLENTLIDAAPYLRSHELRRALARAEHRYGLDLRSLAASLGRGRRGSAAVRRAIARHLPELARTLSPLEERFLELCERYGIPLPEVNMTIEGVMVDALWRSARVVVELDGRDAHQGAIAMASDRDRDLRLRAAGYTVLRYTWHQVVNEPERVAADLLAALASDG